MAQPLASTYKRYKAGTSKLISWLSRNGRLGTSTSKRLTSGDLITCAERIVNSRDPIIEITLDILDITKDVITGRTAAARFYADLAIASNGCTALEEANASHAHFLNVLQRVFDVLKKEHKSRRPKRKKKMPELPTDVDDLTNLYRHLELQEEHGEIQDESQQETEKTVKSSTQHDDQLVDENEDRSFAIFCLFKDLNDIRDHVKDIWTQSGNNDITLMTALRLTEQAMSVSSEIVMQFELQHPDLRSLEKIMTHMGAQDVLQKPIIAPKKQAGGTKETMSQDKPLEIFVLEAWHTLDEFETARKQALLPATKPQTIDGVGCQSQGHRLSKLLMDALSGLTITVPGLEHLANIKSIDEFCAEYRLPLDVYTCHFLQYIISGERDLAFLACTELYMVIHDAMEGNMNRCLDEAEAIISRMIEHERKHWTVFEKSEYTPSAPITIGQQRLGQHGWVLNSACSHVEQEARFIPIGLLKAFPLLPAVNAYMFLYTKQYYILKNSDLSLTVLAAAHLYHGCKIVGAIQKPWTDMEFFVAAQNALHGFARLSDTRIRSVVNSFGLALGLSLKTVLSSNQPRLPTPDQVRASATKCMSMCRASHFKFEQYLTNINAKPDTPLRMLYDVVKKHVEQIEDPIVKEQFKATRKLTAVQLLKVLQQFIVKDEPYLHFDCLKFYRRCVEWLAFAEVAQRGVSVMISKKPSPEGYQMVHSMLWNASSAEANGIDLKKTLLYRAGVAADRGMKTPRDECMRGCLECCGRRVDEKPGSTNGDQNHAIDHESQGEAVGDASMA
ncbi:hypothetical protein HII31_12739 [Pseudocercospora fuligena]|uniref:DUF6604 domain-containing protein n=1 Tax=Pseudocercospora fuligena TaxID=685502 RepID=A0A8H6R4Q5_9PEZI|nr:hypothetical protein HII31_12739 [Pseudocercospora fuligena]